MENRVYNYFRDLTAVSRKLALSHAGNLFFPLQHVLWVCTVELFTSNTHPILYIIHSLFVWDTCNCLLSRGGNTECNLWRDQWVSTVGRVGRMGETQQAHLPQDLVLPQLG